MGLATNQEWLARLFTDARLREAMLAHPEGLGRALDLEADETVHLARELDLFSKCLIHKRRGEVEKLLGLSRQAIGSQEFGALFMRFARQFVAYGVKKHRTDAIAFAEFLRRSGSVTFPWIHDLIAYEAAMLAASDRDRRLIINLSRHALVDLALAAQDQGTSPPIRNTLSVWLRLGRGGRLRRFAISLPRAINRSGTKRGAEVP